MEIRRTTQAFDPGKQGFVAQSEMPAPCLGTVSTVQAPAREFARLVREQGTIENRLHQALDAPLVEHASHIRLQPRIPAACVNVA